MLGLKFPVDPDVGADCEESAADGFATSTANSWNAAFRRLLFQSPARPPRRSNEIHPAFFLPEPEARLPCIP